MDKTKIDLETHGPAAGVTTKDWLAAIDAALSRLCRGVSFSDDGADKSGTTADKTSGNRDHTSDSEEAPDSEEDASEPRYPVSNIRRSTNHISIHFLRSLDAEIVIRHFMDNEYPSEGREGSEGRSLFEVALFKYGIRISRVKTRGAQEDVKRGGVKRISDSQRWKTALLVEDKSEATLEIIELLGGKLLDTQGNLFLLQKFNRDGENQDGTEKRKISSSVNVSVIPQFKHSILTLA